jgi:hypothetical protein
MLTLIIALSAPANAATVGYCHPVDIASMNTEYTRASNVSSVAFSQAQEKTSAMSHALSQYAEAIDLFGQNTPQLNRDREKALRVTFNREYAQLSAFANTMMDDFDQTFLLALDRNIASIGGKIEVCEGQIPVGRTLPGMPTRFKTNPSCVGDDLNSRISAAMDQDKELIAAIDEIIALVWPTISIDVTPIANIGEADEYLNLDTIIQTHFSSDLREIAQEDDMARTPIMAKIEQGATKEERQAMVTEAHAIDADTAAKRTALAAPVIQAIEAANKKRTKKGAPTVGWCLNPPLLGGCHGQDVTETLMPTLMAVKKVRKALEP